MYIVYDKPSKLCNRIWALLPILSTSFETKEKVYVISLRDYSKCFQNLNKNKNVRFIHLGLLAKGLRYLRRRFYIYNENENFLSKNFNIKLYEGWPDKGTNLELTEKYRDQLKSTFQLDPKLIEGVDQFFESVSAKYDVIVGIHIRRAEDYKVLFQNGRFYFSDEVFRKAMTEISSELQNAGKKVGFLICSDTKINLENFPGMDCFTIPKGTDMKDLYAMSKCDYLIGPPSTFSQWSSFLGEVPLKFIMSKNEEKVSLSHFSRVISLDHFENGHVLKLD